MKARDQVIILCGGLSIRWNNFTNIEKHFVEFNHMKLIENTLIILDKFDLDILIVTREDNINLFSCYNFRCIGIPLHQSQLEFYKIKSTLPFWSELGKTIILMGDVWYSEKSLKKILHKNNSKVLFFGRQGINLLTKCKHGELFAIVFSKDNFQVMIEAVAKLENYILHEQIKITGGWGIYNIISKMEFLMTQGKIIKGKVKFSNFINIFDLTDDVDSPNSYFGILSAIKRNKFNNKLLYSISYLIYFLFTIKNIFFELKLIVFRKLSLYIRT